MRVLAPCLAALFVAVAAAPAADPKEKTNADKIVGTWTLVKSDNGTPEGVRFLVEWTKEGKMTLRIEPKAKDAEPVVLKGTYKVNGDKLDYTIDDGTGGTRQEVLTIKKLTDEELVTVDPKEIKEEFKRVKPDKKDDKKPEKK
jgi:uncharacterized protein (TIGR03066 family)